MQAPLVWTPSPPKSGTWPPLPSFIAPPGWTTTPSGDTFKDEWLGRNSEGQIIARCHGLGPARPIMEDLQAWTTMFQADGKFFVWGRMDDTVREILSRDLHEILSAMATGGLREVQMVDIPCLYDPSELGDGS
ncbi:uncharacterized protein CDV56_109384 [Aspergillus thermomutatus]|uniref:Uncharacterized protein n=1 Tax=Aspergillus thermomutatus TaxID=41047 RepID=A0A397HRL1_ASPTH|nr:uncharacterized protein CDV56_109384 [Aspergillus thermomutatus]RHZ64608.1 hypothetical protein CDV56_109384 [Aspergillus thermomutatus]